MYEAVQEERFPNLQRVGYWKSIHIRDIQVFQSLTTASQLCKKEIPALAQYYVLTKYNIPTDGTMSCYQVITAALETLLQMWS
jgi:hypothetical protein